MTVTFCSVLQYALTSSPIAPPLDAHRFSEWSFACWELQKAFLTDSSPEATAYDFSSMAVYHSDDHQHLQSCRDTVAGRAMSQWWDVSAEAGPAVRPAATFDEDPPTLDVLAISGSEVKNLGSNYVCVYICFFFHQGK